MEAKKRNGSPRKRIGIDAVEGLEPGEEIWDTTVRGFGARRRGGPSVSYFVMFRTAEGRLRRYTIGQHGAPWTPEQARTKALSVLAEAKVQGRDPAATKKAAREAATVNDLCSLYWADAEAGKLMTRRRQAKKPSTLLSDKGRIDKHIRPLLGPMKVAAVTTADVETFMHNVAAGKTAVRTRTGNKRGLSNVRGGSGAASRTVGLLGAIFTYAVRKGMRHDNPVRGVMRPADGRRERRLSDDEYSALGEALAAAERESHWPAAVACARFLALTGWRSGEALGLRWADADLVGNIAILAETKTGRSERVLSHQACKVLKTMPHREDSGLVFPGSRGDGTMSGFRKMWSRIVKLGGLPADVTPHVLRHSFASVAADLGYTESTIAALIGHQGHTVTSRYMHPADEVLLAAADKVAQQISERMARRQGDGCRGAAPKTRPTAKARSSAHSDSDHAAGSLQPYVEDGTIFVPQMPQAFEAKDVREIAHAAGIAVKCDAAMIGSWLKAVVELFVSSAQIEEEHQAARKRMRSRKPAITKVARENLFYSLANIYYRMTGNSPSSHDTKGSGRINKSSAVVWVRGLLRHAHDRFEAAPGTEHHTIARRFVRILCLSDSRLGDLLVHNIAVAKGISRELPAATHGAPPKRGRGRPLGGRKAKVGLAPFAEKGFLD